jgi:hypothetical protein
VGAAQQQVVHALPTDWGGAWTVGAQGTPFHPYRRLSKDDEYEPSAVQPCRTTTPFTSPRGMQAQHANPPGSAAVPLSALDQRS